MLGQEKTKALLRDGLCSNAMKEVECPGDRPAARAKEWVQNTMWCITCVLVSMAIASPFANPNPFQPKAQSLHAESNNAIHWQLSEGIIRHVGSRQEAHIRAVAFCNTSQGQMCSNMAWKRRLSRSMRSLSTSIGPNKWGSQPCKDQRHLYWDITLK